MVVKKDAKSRFSKPNRTMINDLPVAKQENDMRP